MWLGWRGLWIGCLRRALDTLWSGSATLVRRTGGARAEQGLLRQAVQSHAACDGGVDRAVWIGRYDRLIHRLGVPAAHSPPSLTVTPRVGALCGGGSGRVRGHVSVPLPHTRLCLPLRIAQPTPSSLQPTDVHSTTIGGGYYNACSTSPAPCVPHSYAIATHSATSHDLTCGTANNDICMHLTTPTTTKQLPRARLYVLQLLADQRLHLCASKVGTCDV